MRVLTEPWTAEGVSARVAAYDAADAGRVTDILREEADLERTTVDLIRLYDEVIAEHRDAPAASWVQERRAIARYFRWLAPRLKMMKNAH